MPDTVKLPATKVNDGGLPKLAFTLRETAQVLSISYPTAYRLVQRGLLKSSSALRTKLIARSEIERFLAVTSK